MEEFDGQGSEECKKTKTDSFMGRVVTNALRLRNFRRAVFRTKKLLCGFWHPSIGSKKF